MTLFEIAMWLVFVLGIGGVKYLDKKKKNVRGVAWYFIILSVLALAMNVFLEELTERSKEDCLECKTIGYSGDGRRWILEK